ncbi:MAG: hypothetical protein RL196_1199 [Actinomycetota bacterium]
MVVEQLNRVGFSVRDYRLLQGALARPQTTFEDSLLYPTFELQAAALMHSVVKNHALFDGNKRSSWLILQMFAGLNGMKVTASADEAYEFVLAVAKDQMTLDDAADWIARHLIVISLG